MPRDAKLPDMTLSCAMCRAPTLITLQAMAQTTTEALAQQARPSLLESSNFNTVSREVIRLTNQFNELGAGIDFDFPSIVVCGECETHTPQTPGQRTMLGLIERVTGITGLQDRVAAPQGTSSQFPMSLPCAQHP